MLVGGLGFLMDGGLTMLLISKGVDARTARIPALISAILMTWILNRSFTYRVPAAATKAEFLRYFAVASSLVFFNYAVYLLLLYLTVPALYALVFASVLQAAFSYFAYQRIVFNG